MPKIILTKHVKIRIKEREIDKETIEEVVINPDEILPGMFGRSMARKNYGGKTLEVVYVKEKNNLIIITAYFITEKGDNK
jgi:hypothetical protein